MISHNSQIHQEDLPKCRVFTIRILPEHGYPWAIDLDVAKAFYHMRFTAGASDQRTGLTPVGLLWESYLPAKVVVINLSRQMYIYTSIWVIRSSEKAQLSRRLLHALRIIILIGAAWARTSCLSSSQKPQPRKSLDDLYFPAQRRDRDQSCESEV